MGAFCAEYRRRRPPGSIERRDVGGVNGRSDGEDVNDYVCTEQEVEEGYVQMLEDLRAGFMIIECDVRWSNGND